MKKLILTSAIILSSPALWAQQANEGPEYQPVNMPSQPIIFQPYPAPQPASNAQTASRSNQNGYQENANKAWQNNMVEEFPPIVGTSLIDDPSLTLIQGTVIEAVFTGAVSSQLPGSVRATTSRTVYSMDGTRILIPRGSSLYGEYRAETMLSQTRLAIVWSRVVTPDGLSAQISSAVTDSQGRTGGTGRVDTHFMERFGSAALISLLGVAPVLAASSTGDDTQLQIASDIGADLQDATSTVLEDYLSITPTIHIDQGTRISAILQRDVVFDGY